MAAPGRSLSQPIRRSRVQTALRKQRMPQLQRPPCDPVAIRVRGGSILMSKYFVVEGETLRELGEIGAYHGAGL